MYASRVCSSLSDLLRISSLKLANPIGISEDNYAGRMGISPIRPSRLPSLPGSSSPAIPPAPGRRASALHFGQLFLRLLGLLRRHDACLDHQVNPPCLRHRLEGLLCLADFL